MKILQYYDQNHNKKRGIINYKDLKIVSTLQTGEKELSFSLPHNYAKDLVNEGYIRTQEDEYVIKNINSSKDYDSISCNLNLEELEGNFFDGFDSTRNTIDKCIQLLIAGTGWTCEVIGDINKKRTIRKTGTLLEILTQIKSTYLVEIEFDSLNKVIKVYDEIGSDKGAYMMDSINLDEIQVDADSYGFATKMVAFGAVDEGTQMPISVTVTNNEYSNKVISLMWKDERYTILEHLKEDAEAKLSEICKPRKAYYTHVYDLAKMNPKYSLLSYKLGDTITLISKDLEIKEKQRIVKITEFPDNPENNICEISNRIYTVEDILQSQNDTETVINNITSTNDKISPLAMDEGMVKLIKVDIQQLNAVSAKIGELIANKIKADVADIDEGIIGHLLTQKIEAQDLVASNIKFDIAEGGTLSVKDLLTKFLSAGSTETLHLTAGNVVIDDAVIKSAMIDSVSADKIKAGTLDANNVTLLAEKEGYKLVQTGRLFQWFKNINGTYVLIAQLGFDASNKFTFAIKDESGTYTVYDEKGITEHAVPNQIIVDDMVSDSANINGKKLNIDSLITEINDNDTKTIKGSKILIDSTGQTIDVSFDTLSETVNDIGESTKAIQTDLKVEQGKVEQLIKDTNIISGETSELKDSYNEIKSTVDGTVQTVSSIETKVNKNTGDIKTASNKINEIKTTVDGTVQTVSGMETKINKNTGDIETASNKINEIKTTVDGTVQTVSSVETKVNNINATNLFRAGGGKYLSVDDSIWIKTSFKSGDTFTLYGSDTNKFYRIYNASDNNYIYVTNNTPIKAPDNKKISISFWYYCNNAVNTLVGIKNIRLYILQELNESGNFYNAYKMAELNKTLTAQQYKGTFELDENCTRYKIRFDLDNGTLSNGAKTQFVFKDVAVVDGLIPSNEWTPSFEDVQSDIDVVGSRVSSCEVKTTDEYFSVQVQKNQNRKFAVRYIRDYCKGSSADADYCNWIEIKAINTSGVNVALNKTPTSNISITNASVITNGIYENKSQFATGKASNNTIPYVQIDLGKIYNDIDEIKVWHYYSDSRRYHKTKTEISADGSNWITLFDSDVSGEYVETQFGHSIKVNGDSFNSSQVVINELGLHVYNGAMDISNKAGDKVFEADADGNLKITGVMEQRNSSTKYLSTSLNNNGLGIYNYAENGDLTGGIVSLRDRYGGSSAFVFCDESNHLDLGYRTGGTENDFGTGTFVSCLSVSNKGGENDPKLTMVAPTSYEHVEHHKNGIIYMYDDKITYFMDGTKMNDDKIRVVRTMADSNSLAYVMNGFYSRIKFQVKKDGVISNQMILGTDKVYVTSDFSVTGKKNRLVHTERYGYVNQNAYETCSPYFGDIMRATINEDGYCAVIIEDVFKETVNTKYQYEVCILGVYGNLKMTDEELKNLWCRCIDQQEDHFLLRGTPGAQVGIEVKALQRGYEGERLSQSTDIVDNERVDLIEKPSTNEEEIEMPVIDDTESESILEAEFKTEESTNNNNPDNKNTNDSDIIIQEDNSQYIKEGLETKGPENNTSIDNLFFDLCNE